MKNIVRNYRQRILYGITDKEYRMELQTKNIVQNIAQNETSVLEYSMIMSIQWNNVQNTVHKL